MSFVRALCLTLAALAVPAPAHALQLYYLALPGISGEAGPPGPAGSIQILSWSLESNSFSFTKEADAASPALFLAAVLGTSFATAQVDRVDTDVLPSVPIAIFVFGDVLISSIAPASGGGSIPLEAVTLAFANVNVPEPTAALLVSLGCVALGAGARRPRVG